MHIVVIKVKALFGIDAAASAKRRMKDLPIRHRFRGFRDDDYHLGIRSAFLEKSPHRNKIEHLSNIPAFKKRVAEAN
jgi:hypothetical protein